MQYGRYMEGQPGQYVDGTQSGRYGDGVQPGRYGDGAQPGRYGDGAQPGRYGDGAQPGQYADGTGDYGSHDRSREASSNIQPSSVKIDTNAKSMFIIFWGFC